MSKPSLRAAGTKRRQACASSLCRSAGMLNTSSDTGQWTAELYQAPLRDPCCALCLYLRFFFLSNWAPLVPESAFSQHCGELLLRDPCRGKEEAQRFGNRPTLRPRPHCYSSAWRRPFASGLSPRCACVSRCSVAQSVPRPQSPLRVLWPPRARTEGRYAPVPLLPRALSLQWFLRREELPRILSCDRGVLLFPELCGDDAVSAARCGRPLGVGCSVRVALTFYQTR